MDREPEELQFLGLIGTTREAYKLVLSWRRLFAQITLALIFPLAFISLAHIHISHLLFSKIDRNEVALDRTPDGSPAQARLLSRISSEVATALLFKAAYLVGVLIFALLSTSAVVYTIASVYTAKDLSFHKVLSVVPKVWKRLMVTFLWAFLLLAAYNIVSLFLMFITIILLGSGPVGVTAVVLVFLAYAAGLVWISVVWHVASVVSVLEDVRGIEAMKKSRSLVRGKLPMAIGIFLVLNLSFMGIEFGYRVLVVEPMLGLWERVGCAALILSLLSLVILMGLVVQTVVYFVCKSYHHESIDKSSLADHLEVYLGEYEPLRAKDVQLEQYYV